MTFTAIWIVAWLLNGTPVAFAALLPGNECTLENAQNLYDAYTSEHGRGAWQDGFSWWCDAIDRRPPQGA